eukprot:653613-Pleurochrysis_carterae.AAC.1
MSSLPWLSIAQLLSTQREALDAPQRLLSIPSSVFTPPPCSVVLRIQCHLELTVPGGHASCSDSVKTNLASIRLTRLARGE